MNCKGNHMSLNLYMDKREKCYYFSQLCIGNTINDNVIFSRVGPIHATNDVQKSKIV